MPHLPKEVFMIYMYTATFITKDSHVYARVPDLPGCITSGKSLDEAIDLITDAASVWLVSAEDDGDAIPEASDQSALTIPEVVVASTLNPVGTVVAPSYTLVVVPKSNLETSTLFLAIVNSALPLAPAKFPVPVTVTV